MSSPDPVAVALEPWFADRLGAEAVEISEFKRHAEGWSWQTYTMAVSSTDASGTTRSHGYAVRREPEDGLLAPYDAGQQYRLHEAVVNSSDVPMAALHWHEPDPAPLGMPFYVMDRVEGVVPVQWRGNDPDIFPDDAARHAIGTDFLDVLARIHRIDVAALSDVLPVPADSDDAARNQIDHWERFYLDAQLVEVPLLRSCIAWLRSNVATSGTVSLVHGDYRIGNFMLGPDRSINAIFDWELAHLGDPAFDVAWAGLPLFRGRSPLVSQLLDKDEFLAGYEERTGIRIDGDVLRFWTVFGHLRASAPHIRAARAFAEGRTGDLRLAAMGHQNLYILKQLADQFGWEVPGAEVVEPAAEAGPTQLSLGRIFEGLAASLSDEVAPHVSDPYARAQIRAAVEVLGNLATRVEWSRSQQVATIEKARAVLERAPADAPQSVGDLLAKRVPDEGGDRLTAARAGHLAAVADLAEWLEGRPEHADLRSELTGFLLDDLASELGRLRSGMYRGKRRQS